MNIGEGAGILVLEDLEHARRRGARVYAELAGHALACEALGQFEAGPAVRPLRVLVGEHDVVVSPTGADEVLAGCGHLPPAENPAAVAAVLVRVLEEMRCPTTTA